jgi:UDP-glucose 4-epimerase
VRVLLTGDRGRIGVGISERLCDEGHEVVGFDAMAGDDVRDLDALKRAAAGCAAIIHAAGQPDDPEADPSALMATNLLGTYNALLAARAAAARRFVFFSSGKAIRELDRPPEYLPVDDDHPGRPWRPYGLAKWLCEEMCEAFTRSTGITTVCLRPVAVLDESDYAAARARGSSTFPSDQPWNLGVFIDLADVATAVLAALVRPENGHARLLLCASDIASDCPTLDLVRERLPEVRWRSEEDRALYVADPSRSLLDCRRAREALDWTPSVRWTERVTNREAHRCCGFASGCGGG